MPEVSTEQTNVFFSCAELEQCYFHRCLLLTQRQKVVATIWNFQIVIYRKLPRMLDWEVLHIFVPHFPCLLVISTHSSLLHPQIVQCVDFMSVGKKICHFGFFLTVLDFFLLFSSFKFLPENA